MSRVFEVAYQQGYRRLCATNLTTSGATAYADGGTRTMPPSGNGVLLVQQDNGFIPNGVMLKPFGRGANAATFTLNLYGWKELKDVVAGSLTSLWARETLYQIVCTLSTSFSNTVGSASGVIDTTDYFCSSITMASGYGVENVDYYFQGQPQSIYFDAKSSTYLQLEWVSGTATQVNAFAQLV